MNVFSMSWPWRLSLALLPAAGAAVAIACGLELAGIVPRDAITGGAGDGERWAAVLFGALVQPFGLSALRHARLVVGTTHLEYLGFGFVCRPRSIAFADVRRWGHAVATNRGRSERHLVLELHDRSHRTVKLAMYQGAPRVLEALQAKLGAPAAATATLAGIRFDDA